VHIIFKDIIFLSFKSSAHHFKIKDKSVMTKVNEEAFSNCRIFNRTMKSWARLVMFYVMNPFEKNIMGE